MSIDQIHIYPSLKSDPSRLALSGNAGRRTPRGAKALSLPDDRTNPDSKQKEGRSTTNSGPNYAHTTTAASR